VSHGVPHGPQPFCVLAGGTWAPPVEVVKKFDTFCWTDKMQRVLHDLKALISTPPALASPEPSEILLYVTATIQVISAALVVEREDPGHDYKVQQPVYYISKVLSDCETRCNQIQKLLYTILIAKCKLLHYFDSHPIRVVTSFELREVIGNRLSTWRIAKWALELRVLDISYMPQMTIMS
jgi:hypothetical protein